MLSGMASELSRETLAAKSSLSVLPLENTNLENTYKFLSQVGDFTETLNRKVASGESISDEEREISAPLSRFAMRCRERFQIYARICSTEASAFHKKAVSLP